MTSLNRFFIFFLLVTLALFIQQGGFLNVAGIVPNLLLMMCVVFILFGERIGMIAAVLVATLLSTFFINPFWMMELSVWSLIVLSLAFFRRNFTGNNITDFLLMTLVAETLFYGVSTLLSLSTFPFLTFIYEFAYTVAIGIPVWLAAKRYIL